MKSRLILTVFTIALASAGVCLVIGLSARQAQATRAAPDTLTITIWHQEGITTTLDQIAADFHTLHPTITVQLQRMDTRDLFQQYLYAAASGGGPDLVHGPNDWIGSFANAALIRPVDGDFDLSRFVTQTITATLWRGQHWAVPETFGNHLMLFYNQNLLPTAPVSTTEMISMAQGLTGGGQYGLVYSLNEPYYLIPWLTSYGGWVLDETGSPVTPTLNTPAMTDALQFVHDLRWVHGIVPTGTVDYGSADTLFRNGQAAMIINGDWTLGEYRDLLGSSLGVARLPRMADTGRWPQPMTGGKFYYFNAYRSGSALRASQAFVDYATSMSAQLLWPQNQGILPALLEAFNDPIVQGDPILNGSAEQARQGRLMPTSPEMSCVWTAMFTPIAGVMDDTLPPAQAAADMQAEAAACAGLLRQNTGWAQSNVDGFGDPQNGQIPSLAVFGDYLYAGAQHYDGITGTAQIWRSPNGLGWEQVDNHAANGAAALQVFDGYLYAGSWGDGPIATIWRSPDGVNWTDVITDGFGSTANGIAHFAVFSNTLYASTWNKTGTQIWRTTDGTDWQEFSHGLGNNPNNGGAIASAEFDGALYWGVGNWAEGAELWRTDGLTWTQIISHGFGMTENAAISSLEVFNGYLYAGVWNSVHAQVWRSPNGTDWTQVTTTEIGTPDARMASSLEVYHDQLYLIIENDTTGAEVWRTANGLNWVQIGFGGMGDSSNHWTYFDNATLVFQDRLTTALNNFETGGEIWQYAQPQTKIFLPVALKNSLSVQAPDVIYHNGVVLTMEPGQPQAQAIALRGDRILAVGSNAEILDLQGKLTQVINLEGRTLLPGFNDSHAHRIGDRGLWGYTTPDQPIQAALELGYTSISELWVNSPRLDELRMLDSQDRLRLRVNSYLTLNAQYTDFGSWYQAYQPRQRFSPYLRIAGVKITLDQEWGQSVFFTQEQLNAKVLEAHQLGWQVAIHAFPDTSQDLVLNAYENALNGASNTLYRHRIEHVAIVRDDQLARMASLGILASVQLSGTSGWPDDPSFQAYVPPELWPKMARFRDMLAAGVPMLGNTDAPWGTVDWRNHVNPSHNGSPLWALYEGATRIGYWGRLPEDFQLAQTITVQQGLELLTIRGAYATFEEEVKGSLAPGKYADLVILSDNPLTVPLTAVPNIQVLLTLVGGHTEYCAPGSAAVCP